MKPTPIEFARLIAKIAHSHTVAHIGLDKFAPFLPPLILGRDSRLGYYVGGAYHTLNSGVDDLESPTQYNAHLIRGRIGVFNDAGRQRLILRVDVRLFASLGGCTYTAIVGEIATPDQRARFIMDCLDTGKVELSLAV